MSSDGVQEVSGCNSTYLLAIFFLSSGEQSMDPIAPTPSVGINPMMASSTVRTGKRKNLLHYVILKRVANSGIVLAPVFSLGLFSVAWCAPLGSNSNYDIHSATRLISN